MGPSGVGWVGEHVLELHPQSYRDFAGYHVSVVNNDHTLHESTLESSILQSTST